MHGVDKPAIGDLVFDDGTEEKAEVGGNDEVEEPLDKDAISQDNEGVDDSGYYYLCEGACGSYPSEYSGRS